MVTKRTVNDESDNDNTEAGDLNVDGSRLEALIYPSNDCF